MPNSTANKSFSIVFKGVKNASYINLFINGIATMNMKLRCEKLRFRSGLWS